MIIANRTISDLSDDDLEYIFHQAFPQIPDSLKSERLINIYKEKVLISNLGCTLLIWSDYRVEMFSDVMPYLKIDLIKITNALLEKGAITYGMRVNK
jgi:hypothetical protein